MYAVVSIEVYTYGYLYLYTPATSIYKKDAAQKHADNIRTSHKPIYTSEGADGYLAADV